MGGILWLRTSAVYAPGTVIIVSTRNTSVSIFATGPWRVDSDRRQDRGSGPVTTRQMTEEEMKRYGITKGDIEDMTKKLNIDHQELLAVCREFGTGKEAYMAVAKKFDISEKQAANQIFNQKIPRELKAEKKEKEAAVGEGAQQPLPEETVQEGPLPETIEGPQGDNAQPEVINNAEAADKMEPEEYPNLTEAFEKAQEVMTNASEEVNVLLETMPFEKVVEKLHTELNEAVNHPSHYTTGNIEVIDYLQDKLPAEMFEGFCVGNSLKYLSRYRYKGGLDDLKKARWYLDRIIKIKEVS
jgi:plasmid maintenance system antidote protein VapI